MYATPIATQKESCKTPVFTGCISRYIQSALLVAILIITHIPNIL